MTTVFLLFPRSRICSKVLIFTSSQNNQKSPSGKLKKCFLLTFQSLADLVHYFVQKVVQVLLLINYWFLNQSSDNYFLKRMLDPVGFLCIHCLQKMDEIVSSKTETKSAGLISCPKCTKARKTPISGFVCFQIIKFPVNF